MIRKKKNTHKEGTKKPRSKITKRLWQIFAAGTLFFILFVISVSYNWFGLYGDMPNLKSLENPEDQLASEIYSEDNVLLGQLYRENRSPATYEELSPNLINALIATEDIRFQKHSGIDFRGTARVLFKTVLKGERSAGGGSTVTQQLAKNLFNTRDKDDYIGPLAKAKGLGMLVIKMKEWMTAVRLEQAYTKEEIIFMYFNTVDFGSNAYGIKTASKTFFDKLPGDLNIEEAALLVGLLKAPTRYNPVRNPENALQRRNVVLAQMKKYEYLTQEEFDSLSAIPIDMSKYHVQNHHTGSATYFRDAVKETVKSWAKENGYDIYSDGLKIYTTINSKLQRHAENAVTAQMKKTQKLFFSHWKGRNPWIDVNYREIKGYIEKAARKTDRYRSLKSQFDDNTDSINHYMNKPVPMTIFTWDNPKYEIDTVMSPMDSLRYYKHFLHSGFVSMDPKTGYVKAWVGGINHTFFQFDHVKQSKRQPGSTFKPIVYTAAMDQGYSPCFEVTDEPVTFENYGRTWTPRNSGGKYTYQSMTLRRAMGKSVNSITAAMTKRLTPEKVEETAKILGIESELEPVPSICLGVKEVSLFELIGAYCTFANKGIWNRPIFITRIEDKNGNVLKEFFPESRDAISEETAYLMLHMLKGTVEPGGTASSRISAELKQDNDIGAKTGTTQNNSDGWFVGVTKDLVSGGWVGGEERVIHFRSTSLGQGAATALPIWNDYMLRVYADKSTGIKKGFFEKPAGELSVELNCAHYKAMNADSTAHEDSGMYVAPDNVDFDD